MRRGAIRVRTVGAATTLLVAAVLLALALAAAGCDMPSTGGLGQVSGSGKPATKTYEYTGFTKVVVDSGFMATIERGDSYAVSVTVDDNLLKDKLKVELDGDTLHIGLAPLWQFRDVTLKAKVTLPRLTGLEVSGASTADAVATGDDLDLAASGASAVTLAGPGKVALDVSGASRVDGAVLLDELAGEVSGASVAACTGSADALRLDVSGGSRLDLMGLVVHAADLTISGGSRGRVMVTDTLTADVSGGSRLEYAGDPQLGAMDVSGGSAAEPAGN